MPQPPPARSAARLHLLLRNLPHLRAAADEGSLHRAGERLGIAQSALSRRLAEVEAELGGRLFDRGSAGVSPTPAGAVFLLDVAQVMSDLDRAIRRFDLSQLEQASMLRIGVNSASVMYPAMARGLDAFRRRYPRCDLRLSADLTEAQYAALEAGRIDLGIAYLLAPEPALVIRPLATDRIVLAMPADHPLAQAAEVRLGDLDDKPLIGMQRETSGRLAALVAARLKAAGVRPRMIMEAGSSEATLTLVAAGLGPAFINRSQAGRTPPFVVVREVSDLDLDLTIAAFWHPEATAPLIEAFAHQIGAAFDGAAAMP